MPSCRIVARPPQPSAAAPAVVDDPDTVASYLEDAAHFPGGHAAGVTVPRSEAEVAAILLGNGAVLPIGAQSSVTGGATPRGELVLSTARLDAILEISDSEVRVMVTEAGNSSSNCSRS